jgi:hypothetical protein
MKKQLSVLERILLLSLLPQKENIDTLRVIHDLKMNLSLTEDDIKEFDFKTDENGRMSWNERGLIEKDIEIGEKAMDICKKSILRADADRSLTEQHFTLYDKFV